MGTMGSYARVSCSMATFESTQASWRVRYEAERPI